MVRNACKSFVLTAVQRSKGYSFTHNWKNEIIERKDTLETFNLRTNLQKSIWVRSYTVLFYTSFTAIKVLKIISYLLEDNIPLEFFLSLFLFGRDFSASEYNAPDKFCLPSPETKALFRTSRNELNQFKYMLMRSFGGLKVSGSESKVLKGDFHKKKLRDNKPNLLTLHIQIS